MSMLMTVLRSILLIFGSLLGAIFLCMLLWRILAMVSHPEYGALAIILLTVVAIAAPLTHSPFVRMTLLFAMAGAVPLWIAGREWRAVHKAGITGSGRRNL